MRRFVLGAALALSTWPAMAQSTDTPELMPGESVVRVHAEAMIERMPDVFGITVTIESSGATPREAADQNKRKVAEFLAILRAEGIGQATTELEEYSASAVYEEDDRNRNRPIGYRASQDVAIELNDFGRVEPLVDRFTAAGFSDLRAGFGLRDRRTADLEARRNAVAEARREAENVAAALGKKVGRLLLVGTDHQRYTGNTVSESIIVTGSRNQPQIIKPAPIEVESEIYADWSLVDR